MRASQRERNFVIYDSAVTRAHAAASRRKWIGNLCVRSQQKKKMALRKPPHPDVVQWTFSSRRGKKISAHYARVFNRENAKKKKPAKKWDFSAVITEGVTSCHPLVSWFTSSVYKEKKKTNLSLVLLSPPTATISPSAFSIYETVNRFLLRGSFFFFISFQQHQRKIR